MLPLRLLVLYALPYAARSSTRQWKMGSSWGSSPSWIACCPPATLHACTCAMVDHTIHNTNLSYVARLRAADILNKTKELSGFLR